MSSESLSPSDNSGVVDRVDQLASALLDEVITDNEIRELGVMLEDQPAARSRYIEYLQLHCDLIEHYGGKKRGGATVLGSLGMNGDLVAEVPIVAPPTNAK